MPAIDLNSGTLCWVSVQETNRICVAFWKLFISTVAQGWSFISLMPAWLSNDFSWHDDQECIHLWFRWKPGVEAKGSVAIYRHVSPTCFVYSYPPTLSGNVTVCTNLVHSFTYQTNMKHISANLVNLLEGTTRRLFMSTTPDLPLCSPGGMHCLFHTELLNIEPRGSHQAVVKLFNKLIQLFQAFISC